MVREFLWSRRRLLGVLVVCVVLVAGLALLWPGGRVAEAAVLDPHPGLVGWWRFDEGVGSVVKDSSGFGNDGAVYGAAWVDGKYGKALSFDGTNDYVQVPDDPSQRGMGELTILLWWKATAWAPEYYGIVTKWSVETQRHYLLGYPYDGKIWFFISDGVDSQSITAVLPSVNVWSYIAAVFKGGEYIKMFINNVEVASASTTINTISNAEGAPLYVGRYSSYYANGVADEVRIYNRALSAAEIQASFQKRPDFSSKLLAKVPKGTTQVLITLSWQGIGTINITIESPSKSYTEGMVPVYQKTVYSTTGGTSSMLNIKRFSLSVTALSSDENWYVVLEFDGVEDYRITVEVQK